MTAWTLDRASGEPAASEPEPQEPPGAPPTEPASWPLWVALGSGLAALMFEVVWFRVLVLVFGSTVYSFSAMLSTFLLGIALGSLVVGRIADRFEPAVRLLALVQGAVALCVVAGGLAAIVRDYFLAGFYPGGSANPANALTPSGSLVKAVLLASGEDIQSTASPQTSITVAKRYSSDAGYGRANLPGDHGHPLMEVIDFSVFTAEVAEETAAEEAAGLRADARFEPLKGRLLVRLEDPLHHLLVGSRRKIHPPGRRMAVQIFREGHHPDLLLLDERQKPLEPAVVVNPLMRAGPDAELLPVVTENGRPARVADRSEIGLDVLERVERDEIAQGLVDRKDAQAPAFVLGDIGRGQVADARIMKMLFIEEGELDPRRRQGPRQVGLPDALRQPEAPGLLAEILAQKIVHHPDLPEAVLLRDNGQDGLVESAAEELDLMVRRASQIRARTAAVSARTSGREEDSGARAGVARGPAGRRRDGIQRPGPIL